MDNIVAVMSLENGLQTQGEYEIRAITRGECNSELHKSSEVKQSSFHTPFFQVSYG